MAVAMDSLSVFKTLAPYHIIIYGTLFGSQFFQTFIASPIAHKTLGRPQFSLLQEKTFPAYFFMQVSVSLVLAITYPGARPSSGSPASLRGVLTGENKWCVLAPILIVFATSLVNLVFLGPAAKKLILEKRAQDKRDGKANDPSLRPQDLRKRSKAFGRVHRISTILNLAGVLATGWYGVSLAGRLQ